MPTDPNIDIKIEVKDRAAAYCPDHLKWIQESRNRVANIETAATALHDLLGRIEFNLPPLAIFKYADTQRAMRALSIIDSALAIVNEVVALDGPLDPKKED